MKELSLNILDIVQNSVRAGATDIAILLTENEETLSFTVSDNGCGMKADFLARVTDPFATTRTTRKVGLGIPFLKMEAEQTGGFLTIVSRSAEETSDHGTEITASFYKNHIDFIPLGNIIETVCTLVHGTGDVDFSFRHTYGEKEVVLSTAELRSVLGDDIPLSEPAVIAWVREYLAEGYTALYASEV